MKLFKKITGAVVAIALVLTTIFTVSAFKSQKEPVLVRYQYMENSNSELFDHTKWDDVTSTTPENCGDAGTLPCVIEFDSVVYEDIEAFLIANPNLTSLRANSTEISTKEALNP